MKVRIIPSINYFGDVVDYGEGGRVYPKNINILTKPFTIDIKSPPRRRRRRGGFGSVPLTQQEIKTYTTNRIKQTLRRRVLNIIRKNLYTDISVVSEDNEDANSPPIKFYLENTPEAKVGRGGTEEGFVNWVRNNFTNVFRIVRANNRRAQNINWGQERVFLNAPNRIVYDRDCFFQPSENCDVSCAYEFIRETFGKTAGFKKIANSKEAIDKAIKLPQQYQKDIYNSWLSMYYDDRHLEKFMGDKVYPLPEIVDVEDLDDDIFEVIDMNVKHEYTEEEKERSLSIMDIVRWCVVGNVRCVVIDYDNTYYCSYNPQMYVGVHKKVSTSHKRTIALKVSNDHAYFIEDSDYKKSLSNIETKYNFGEEAQSTKRKKKEEEEEEKPNHEYHLHPVKDLDIDFMRLRDEFPNCSEEWRRLYAKELSRTKLCRENPPPSITQLKEWASDKDIHHYSINQVNLNRFINLLHKVYGMTPTNCIGGMTTIHFATYGNLRVYSNKRKPKAEWKAEQEDEFFKQYPDALSKNGVEPSPTKIASAIYNKEYKERDNVMSMYNDQTRSIFYDAEIKPITRIDINRGECERPVYGVDINKAYTSVLENNTYKWNVFDSISQPQRFNGKLNTNYFYLCKNLTQEYPCKEGKGLILYHGSYLQHLRGKVIPKYVIRPSQSLDPKHFELFVQKCKEWDGKVCGYSFKQLVNCFVGFMKLKDGIGDFKHFITTSKQTANREIIRNKTPSRLNTDGLSYNKEALVISWATKHTNFKTCQPIRLQVIDMINEQLFLMWRHYNCCLKNYQFAYKWLNNIKQRKVLQKVRNKKSVPAKIKRDFNGEDKIQSIKTDCIYFSSPYKCNFTDEYKRTEFGNTIKVKNPNEKKIKYCRGFTNYFIESWNKNNKHQISLECEKDTYEYDEYVATTGKPQLSYKFIPNKWDTIIEVDDKWEKDKSYVWKRLLMLEGGRIEGKGGRGKSEYINEIKRTMDRNKIRYKWIRGIFKALKYNNLYERLQEWRDKNPCFYKVYAPTNKASNRVKGSTLHKGLGIPFKECKLFDDDDTTEQVEDEIGVVDYLEQIVRTLEGQSYESKERKPSPCYDRIIVDEISMINGEGWSYLAYIHQRIPRIKLIIAGNIENQLPPVRQEYRDFENALIVKEIANRNLIKLNYNFRIGESNDTLWEEWSINPERFGKGVAPQPLTDRNLCYTNATRKKVIELIQDKLKNPVVVECHNFTDIQEPTGQTKFLKYCLGTPLIARQSIKDKNIAKNEMYYVVGLSPLKLFEPETENTIEIDKKELLKWFLSGYCITIHKSQGETYKDKYTIWDWKKISDPELKIGRRLRYVAQSRSTNPKQNIYYK